MNLRCHDASAIAVFPAALIVGSYFGIIYPSGLCLVAARSPYIVGVRAMQQRHSMNS